MSNFSKFQKFSFISIFAILITGGSTNLSAISSEDNTDNIQINATGYITPDSFTTEMEVGTTFSLDRSITVQVEDIIKTTNIAPEKLDILFLADNTDSMGPAIENVQDNARTLLNSLSETYDDLQVGVARYYGDPQEKKYSYEDTGRRENFSKTYTYLNQTKTCINGQGDSYPCYKYHIDYQVGENQSSWTTFLKQKQYNKFGQSHTSSWVGNVKERVDGELGAANAYELQTEMASNLDHALDAINTWGTSAGGNWSEGNFFALHQAATDGASINGYSTGYNTNWRNDAKKIIVWFGDAQSHTNTVSQPEVIQALASKDISVVAIHTRSTAKSETHGLDGNSQASSIASESNGSFASVYSSELTDTMKSLIGNAAVETIRISPSINLSFSTLGDIDGLNVNYTCTDQLGCNNVKNGDTRNFRMDITPQIAGKFTFKTIENATGALADNTVSASHPD